MSRVTTTLNNFDLLDPARMMKRVDAALGTTTVHDKWSEGDIALFAKRVNAVKAGTLSKKHIEDPWQMIVALNAVINT